MWLLTEHFRVVPSGWFLQGGSNGRFQWEVPMGGSNGRFQWEGLHFADVNQARSVAPSAAMGLSLLAGLAQIV